jgi:hypothetical protein
MTRRTTSNLQLDTATFEDSGAFEEISEEEEYYVGGLFSIENSPAFRALDALKGKNVSEGK